MNVSPAETAELIEMPFGMWTQVGPRNCVLDGSPDPPMERSTFEGDDVGIFPYAAKHCHLGDRNGNSL